MKNLKKQSQQRQLNQKSSSPYESNLAKNTFHEWMTNTHSFSDILKCMMNTLSFSDILPDKYYRIPRQEPTSDFEASRQIYSYFYFEATLKITTMVYSISAFVDSIFGFFLHPRWSNISVFEDFNELVSNTHKCSQKIFMYGTRAKNIENNGNLLEAFESVGIYEELRRGTVGAVCNVIHEKCYPKLHLGDYKAEICKVCNEIFDVPRECMVHDIRELTLEDLYKITVDAHTRCSESNYLVTGSGPR